jgi:hypothetical protein
VNKAGRKCGKFSGNKFYGSRTNIVGQKVLGSKMEKGKCRPNVGKDNSCSQHPKQLVNPLPN